MSTRAVIARQTDPDNPGRWEGRYHHWDGYPSGLGRALWHAYHFHFHQNLSGMLTYLLDQTDARCGWSTIVDRNLALEPVSPEEDMAGNLDELYGFPPVSYARRGTEPAWLIDQDAETWCEFAYVFNADDRTMTIYHLRSTARVCVPLDGPEPAWLALDRQMWK